MGRAPEVWLVLLAMGVAANLPFVNDRLMAVGPRRTPKALGWRLLELVVMAGLALALGLALETHIGQRHPQSWEFYAAAGCLFVTLAFPGFVWRLLRRRHG